MTHMPLISSAVYGSTSVMAAGMAGMVRSGAAASRGVVGCAAAGAAAATAPAGAAAMGVCAAFRILRRLTV